MIKEIIGNGFLFVLRLILTAFVVYGFISFRLWEYWYAGIGIILGAILFIIYIDILMRFIDVTTRAD